MKLYISKEDADILLKVGANLSLDVVTHHATLLEEKEEDSIPVTLLLTIRTDTTNEVLVVDDKHLYFSADCGSSECNTRDPFYLLTCVRNLLLNVYEGKEEVLTKTMQDTYLSPTQVYYTGEEIFLQFVLIVKDIKKGTFLLDGNTKIATFTKISSCNHFTEFALENRIVLPTLIQVEGENTK